MRCQRQRLLKRRWSQRLRGPRLRQLPQKRLQMWPPRSSRLSSRSSPCLPPSTCCKSSRRASTKQWLPCVSAPFSAASPSPARARPRPRRAPPLVHSPMLHHRRIKRDHTLRHCGALWKALRRCGGRSISECMLCRFTSSQCRGPTLLAPLIGHSVLFTMMAVDLNPFSPAMLRAKQARCRWRRRLVGAS